MANNSEEEDSPTARDRIRLNPDVIAQRLDDELVVVHLGTNKIYNLNNSAARLWELLERGVCLDEAKEQLVDEFDVSIQELERDISLVLTSLVENQLVKFEK